MVVYFDDILIYKQSDAEHLSCMAQVIVMHAERFHLRLRNAPSVKFLVYVASGICVRMDSSKVQAIVEWPTYTSVSRPIRILSTIHCWL